MADGSMRQRGKDTWQLHVYVGIDPDTGKQRWLAKTVHGSRRYAGKQLQELLEEAGRSALRPVRSPTSSSTGSRSRLRPGRSPRWATLAP
jgi:hypothetical protein